VENNQLSLGHKVKIYGFFMAFEKGGREEIFDTTYLSLEFSIIL
jgi:hypothetical protein